MCVCVPVAIEPKLGVYGRSVDANHGNEELMANLVRKGRRVGLGALDINYGRGSLEEARYRSKELVDPDWVSLLVVGGKGIGENYCSGQY